MIIQLRLIYLLLLIVCSTTACSLFDAVSGNSYGKTLANLPDIPHHEIPKEATPIPPGTLDEIETSYRAALEVATDPNIRHKILIRLADIEMARSEELQLSAVEEKAFFNEAVTMYEELITLNRERADQSGIPINERLMYQLSKAYALDGYIVESDEVLSRLVTNFPESEHAAEAHFRRAELAFADRDYEMAETLYTKVVAVGEDTPFYINSVYMQGWSRFKQNHYQEAIHPFTEVLDRTLDSETQWDQLSNSNRNLAQDTLRVMSILFSYLDGADTITEVYAGLGGRHYQYMLYANLGELYYEKERYRDSADTYLQYVHQFPDTEHSPAFTVKAIDVYHQGGFPSLVLPAKQAFIENYGVRSTYWSNRTVEQREPLTPYLKLYLAELSSYYHAEAQSLDDAKLAYDKALKAGKKGIKEPTPSEANYLKAAELYGEYVFTFPQDVTVPEMTYLQGEAYYSALKLPEAVGVFEKVAFEHIDAKYGADAGYNALLILSELVTLTADAEDEQAMARHQAWQEHKINSAISFSDYYSADSRAVPVLTKAAQELFEQKQLPRAIEVATRLVEWQPTPAVELQKTAWLILAHSRFDQQQYAEAESAYRELLSRLAPEDPQRVDVSERIAAAMYKQGEQDIAAGAVLPAIERFLAIRTIAPQSEIARSAQYDAINKLIDVQDWQRAEAEINDFKARYPTHELTQTLTPKAVFIYQESEQWAKAAGALAIMAQSGDPEQRRNSTYLAAELYEKSGDTKQAIDYYAKYANSYPAPFDIATEARFKLTELYEQTGSASKKDYWLNELINEDRRAGQNRTTRSKSLAAMAAAKFANDDFEEFKSIQLKAPIKKTMKSKKAAMDSALKKYKDVRDYGIADYTTEANHRIAELYAILSRDLMDSERPDGLDELALEQYEILLEEQAFPFEEKAIGIFEGNAVLSQQGVYDKWVKASFKSLAALLPARYGKQESSVEFSDELY